MFQVIMVPESGGTSIEQLGTKEKFWYEDPSLGSCLCKIVRPFTGEDWAEKIACELAEWLGLPHAKYELAEWRETRSVVSPNFVPAQGTLVLGNELLVQIDPWYSLEVARFKQTHHTVPSICKALTLASCELPYGWQPIDGVLNATDMFAGYLMLDALIGNTDRHHENWGLLQISQAGSLVHCLAPTFDHASSLGCHEPDEGRAARLQTRDLNYGLAAYCRRARSAIYSAADNKRALSTLDAFIECARIASGAKVWLSKLEHLRVEEIDCILGEVPAVLMSETSKLFARGILQHNKGALMTFAETL